VQELEHLVHIAICRDEAYVCVCARAHARHASRLSTWPSENLSVLHSDTHPHPHPQPLLGLNLAHRLCFTASLRARAFGSLNRAPELFPLALSFALCMRMHAPTHEDGEAGLEVVGGDRRHLEPRQSPGASSRSQPVRMCGKVCGMQSGLR